MRMPLCQVWPNHKMRKRYFTSVLHHFCQLFNIHHRAKARCKMMPLMASLDITCECIAFWLARVCMCRERQKSFSTVLCIKMHHTHAEFDKYMSFYTQATLRSDLLSTRTRACVNKTTKVFTYCICITSSCRLAISC